MKMTNRSAPRAGLLPLEAQPKIAIPTGPAPARWWYALVTERQAPAVRADDHPAAPATG